MSQAVGHKKGDVCCIKKLDLYSWMGGVVCNNRSCFKFWCSDVFVLLCLNSLICVVCQLSFVKSSECTVVVDARLTGGLWAAGPESPSNNGQFDAML